MYSCVMTNLRNLNVGSFASGFRGQHSPVQGALKNQLRKRCSYRLVLACIVLMTSASGQAAAGDLSCSLYVNFTSAHAPNADGSLQGVLSSETTAPGPIHLALDESKHTVKATGPADQIALNVLIKSPKVSLLKDKILLEEELPRDHAPNVGVRTITINRITGWFELKGVTYSTGTTIIGTDYRFGACTAKK